MKFSINRDELLKAITGVQGVVEKRNTMPILSNILLETLNEEQLQITATDLEVGITATYPIKNAENGRLTLNAKNLIDITRQLPSQEVTFHLKDKGDMEISCGKIKFKLHTLPADDFPSLPELEGQSSFSFPAEDLAAMIDHTAFSVSTDETRYNLSGVFLERLEEGILRMVSSDGHRLSLFDRKIPHSNVKLPENVIIPRKGLMEIRKICSEADGDIELAFSKSNCAVQYKTTRLVIRLIDGEFPDYKQVLPLEEKQNKLPIDRESFLNALKRVSILSQEKTRGVRFQFENNCLKIAVNNPDLGEAEEEIEVQYKGKPLEIGFNAKYFIDVLGIIQTDQVDLFLSDSMSQGMIKTQNDDQFRAVVMPMKLL